MRKILILAGLFIILLAALMPLRLAIGYSGLIDKGAAARSISGTIWDGSIKGLSINGLDLGDLDAAISPLGLLTGRTEIALKRPPKRANDNAPVTPLSLILIRSSDGLGIKNGNGEITASGAFKTLPITTIAATDLNIAFAAGQCRSATGTLRVQIEQSLLGISLQRGLSGVVRCDGDALLIPLQGQSGLEQLDMRVRHDGSYTADLVLKDVSATAALGLTLAGFRPKGGDMVLRIADTF